METQKGLSDFTKHKMQRVFKNEFEVVMKEHDFATTDVAESLAIHNEEMANVNATKKLYAALQQGKIGTRSTKIPVGFSAIEGSEKEVPLHNEDGTPLIGKDGNQKYITTRFVVPEGLKDSLKAITEPNFVKKIDKLRGMQKWQGLVKTVDLSYSFFHHFSMVAQTCYEGGIRSLMNINKMDKINSSPAFGELEQDFTKHTGMTTKIEENQDIARKLLETDDSKIKNLPVVKQAMKVGAQNSEFLFGKLQRFLKVSDYGQKISEWIGKNPSATNEQIRLAKTQIAKEVNAVYGGLNWQAMGITKSELSLLRLCLLAPDWTISNYQLLKFATGGEGEATSLSRKHIFTALVGGMMVTEGLNKMLSGHYTDENPKGHEMEV
jgi:hypothetical protein